jgi:hypothetical protein
MAFLEDRLVQFSLLVGKLYIPMLFRVTESILELQKMETKIC